MAISAFPAQQQPAEDRDVVVSPDGVLAPWAVRPWRNNRNPFRNAGDTNIQEAANDDAKKEEEERDHRIDCDTGAQRAQCMENSRVSDG